MKLPYIPDARDFYMQPVSATYSTFNNQKDGNATYQETNYSRQGTSSNFQKEAMYTQDSNTVFYYNDYRVVLLLDFSQSSTTTFPSMGKSYLEKMRDCLGVITENLLFQIKNELTGQSKRSHESGTGAGQTHKTAGLHFGGGLTPLVNLNFAQPRNSDDSQEESDYNNLGYTSTIEEQYESGCAQPGLQRFTSSEVHHNTDNPLNVPSELHKNAAQNLHQHAFGAESQAKQQQKQKTHEKTHYSPRVYLSVIVSGIPPGNAIKIIMHNQKIDKNNLKDLLTNIEGQLIHIEQNMKNNIKLTSEVLKDYPNADIQDIQGSLQAHLKNAQYILDLMNLDAKPLLVFLTDCSNSLFELHKRFANKQQAQSLQVDTSAHASAKKSQKMQSQQFWQQSGQLDASIHRLHLNDTQLISIDLAEENKVCQQFGFLNHENELAYLSSITQGVHLTYTKLMEIHGKLTDSNFHQSHRRDNQSCSFLSKNLFDKENKVKFNINNGSLNVEDSKPKPQQKSGDQNNNSKLARQKSYSSQTGHQPGNFSIRNVKDKVKLRQINSLQKIMFSRASNYKKFLRSHEIRQLLGTNLVTNEFLLRSELDKKTQHWSDMSVSSLLLQNRIVPILEREGLAEYDIRNVGFASLIEFRSKLGFKFQRVAYSDKTRIMDDSIEQEKPIKSIEYRYCVTQNVYITCILSLEPLSKDLESEKGVARPNLVSSQNHEKSQKPTDISDSGEKIYISYDLYAPSDNLKQINREKFQFNRQIQALEQTKFASKSELSKAKQEKAKGTLYGRLHTFINSIYDRDGHFSLLQKIVQILRQACQAYPQLMQSSESAALAQLHLSSKHKYKSLKISAPESVNINQFIEDKTTAQFNQSHMQTEEQDKSQPVASSSSKHHHSKAEKEKKKKHPKREKSPDEANRSNLTPIEVARKLLYENKHLWERLAKRIACHTDFYQWKCYFRYCMFTIMTQSNRANSKFSAFKTRQSDSKWRHDVDLEKIWIQDRQIERKLFEELQEFANLTINKDTFIHVFTESQAANQYRFGGIGQRHHQNVHGSENQSQDFGFCLIKLKWIASNIAECHLGFYQVGPKQRLKFIKTMRSLFNSQWQTAVDEQNNQKWVNNGVSQGAKESSISVNKGQPFFCYSKNIPSLLMRLPQRQLAKQRKLEKHYLDNAFSDDSANENQIQNNKVSQILKLKQKRSQNQQMEKLRADEMQQQLDYKKSRNYTQIPIKMILFSGAEPISSETTHTSLHDLWKVRFGFGKHGLQPNRTQLFHQHEWRWDNLNEKTNMEFFYRVLQMRLNDGFIIVNRYTGTADYFHLVKVLRAYKERICHKSNIKYKQGGANTSDAKGAPEVQKNEKVEIVVQYIIEHYNERIKEQVAEGEPQMLSVVKAKLFMEKEASFFSVEKNEKTAISKTGSFANLHVTRGHYQSRKPNERFRTAMSRNSSKSKKRIASLSRDSHLSKGSGQQEITGAQSSDTTNESRSGKDFFILMRDYMQEVDQVLRQSTLTYHTMVKNSIKKQVEMHKLLLSDPDAHPLKQQLCYFKNIQASTTRQKKLLEESIREKMLILHSDWSTFLEHQYPESFRQQYRREPRNESQPNFKQNNQKDVYDDQCFNIDQLMLMSKHLAEQKLRAPLLQSHANQSKQQELQSVLNQRFLDQVMRIFDDFADWKMHSLDIKQQKSDLFCKLISKRHLLLIQVPTMVECQQLLKQHESIQVHYFKFSQDRIQVPSYIYDRSSIYKYLQQQEHDKKRRMMISRNHRHAREFNGFKQIRSEQKISTDEQQFSAREESRPRQRVDSDIVQKQPMTDQSDSPPRHLSKTSKDLTPPKEEVHNNNLNQSSLIAQENIDSPTLNNNKGIECSSEPENCSIEPSRDLIKDNKLNSQQSADSQSDKSKDSEIIIKDELLQESEGPSVFFAPKFDSEASEDAEFEIWQVDQKEQVRWYYDHLYRRSRQREKVEFETKVTQIAKNFLDYLSNLLDKAFTEVVLFSFQYNQKWMHKVHQEQKQAANLIDTTDIAQRKSDETYEDLKIDGGDFEYARNTMGYNCFKMDLNFAFLIYFQILLGDYEQERRISKGVSENDYKPSCAKQMDLLNSAQDLIFKETIERNFTRCPVDPSFYIFSHNQYDSFTQDPRLILRQKSAQDTLVSNKEQQTAYSHYQENLKGTQDAYSDTESNSSYGHHKKNQPSEVSDPKEVYRECADLLLEVRGVIKDSSGSIIDTQPINSLSQVFKMAMNRNGLVEELIMKAKGQDQRNRDRMNQLKISMPSKEELKADITQTQFFLNESQEKATFDSQASVDLQFSFYTVPRYVGLIQSKNVNFLRDEKEDILVNDDLQEDLLRVCRLFNLFDCQVTKEKVTLTSPLFRKIKKTQIIKVIPYYFKQMQELDDWEDSMEVAMEENDNRVFFYTEIQRRIIYGILRRTYAMVAECVCEMLTMVQSQTLTSLAMVQKYIGHLLYNQKHHRQLDLILKEDFDRFSPENLKQMLAQELLNNKIVKSAHYYTSKNGQTRLDITQKVQKMRVDKETIEQVLFETIYILQGQTKIEANETESKSQIDFNLPPKWEQAQDELIQCKTKTVKFWCFFTVTADLKLSYAYYLSKFKQGTADQHLLTDEIVATKLEKFANRLRFRIRKLLFLQEIHATKRQLQTVDLEMTQINEQKVDIIEESKSIDPLNASQTAPKDQDTQQPKAKKSKFLRGFKGLLNQPSVEIPSTSETPTTQRNSQAEILTPLAVEQQAMSAIQEPSPKPSLTTLQMSNEYMETQSMDVSPTRVRQDSQTASIPPQSELYHSQQPLKDQIVFNEPKTPAIPEVQQDEQAMSKLQATESDQIKVFKELTSVMRTTHRLSVERAFVAIHDKFVHLMVEEPEDLNAVSAQKTKRTTQKIIVVEKDNTINLIRMTDLGKQIIEGYPQEKLEMDQGQILIEVLGVDRLNIEILEQLKQNIEKQIQQQTMRLIIDKTDRYPLIKLDIDHLKKSPHKRLMMFPISKALTDKLALLSRFKQSLSRKFLNKIELTRQDFNRSKTVPPTSQNINSESNENQETKRGQITLQPQDNKETSIKINFEENDEQLLFNFNNKVSEENKLFGESLALLNFGFVQNLSEKELDEILCSAAPQSEALNNLSKVSCTCIDAQDQQSSSVKNKTQCIRRDQLKHQFSIPTIYAVGNNDNEDEKASEQKSFRKISSSQSNDQKIERNYFPRASEADKSASICAQSKSQFFWLKITAYVLGSLEQEQFVKMVTLLLNQAIADYLFELHLNQSFTSQKLAYPGVVEPESRPQIQPQSQKLLLEKLFQTSLATKSNLSQQDSFTLRGDGIHTNSILTLNMIHELRELFRVKLKDHLKNSTLVSAKSSFDSSQLESSLNFLVIIKKISNQTELQEGLMVLKMPVTEATSDKIVKKELTKHLQKKTTIMKNIRIEVQVIISSSKVQLEPSQELAKNGGYQQQQQQQQQQYQSFEERKDGMARVVEQCEITIKDFTMSSSDMPSPSSPSKITQQQNVDDSPLARKTRSSLTPITKQNSFDNAVFNQLAQLNCCKMLPSIESKLTVKTQDENLAKVQMITHHRNFFIRIEIAKKQQNHPNAKSKIRLETFNVGAPLREQVAKIIVAAKDNGFATHANQSKQLARILGTCYALPKELADFNYANTFANVRPEIQHSSTLLEKESGAGGWPEPPLNSCFSSPSPIKQLQSFANSNSPSNQRNIATHQEANYGSTAQTIKPNPNPIGLALKTRQKRHKKKKKVAVNAQTQQSQFQEEKDPNAWFKGIFSKFLHKKPQLANLLKMEDVQKLSQQNTNSNKERSQSQLRNGLKQSQISASMSVSTNHKHSFMATKQ